MDKKSVIQLTIDISTNKNVSYPIFIGDGILKRVGEGVKHYTSSSKLLLVSNDKVFPIYGNIVLESLKEAGFDVKKVILPDGEDYKNLDCFKEILDKAVEFKLERSDSIVALGGGVIGDMAGYAASSYLRGINLVQMPTTLLAQVDSSIGGKVGINHSMGKNLIGAFYQPKCVIIDVNTLKTLDLRNIKTGLAEVLKYSFIEKTCNYKGEAKNFFAFLNNKREEIYNLDSDVITELVSYCCSLKAAVVEQDEKEAGLRAILNLGHTTGHALEVCGNYKLLTHGEAVSIGIIAALRLSAQKGILDDQLLEKGENLIKDFGLPYKIPSNLSLEDIICAMYLDKKVVKGKIRFVLPRKSLGEVGIYNDISDIQITEVLKTMY